MIKKFLKWLDKILWSKEIKYLHGKKSYEGCLFLLHQPKNFVFWSCINICGHYIKHLSPKIRR